MVCSVIRATSKRLCFMASMARSNRTLSGCFEPTFASGLLTFLLVQPTANASTPSRRMTGIRRDIENLGKSVVSLQWSARKLEDLPTTEDRRRLSLDFLQCGLHRSLHHFLRIYLGIAFTEDGVACHQNFGSGAHHSGHGAEVNTSIYFNTIAQTALRPEIGQPADLVDRPGNEFLPSKTGIHRHHQYIVRQ